MKLIGPSALAYLVSALIFVARMRHHVFNRMPLRGTCPKPGKTGLRLALEKEYA